MSSFNGVTIDLSASTGDCRIKHHPLPPIKAAAIINKYINTPTFQSIRLE